MIKLYKQVGDEVIEFTDVEYAQVALDKIESQRLADEATAKAEIKAAAQAKLAALGLTTDDLTALGL